ncbi:ABC transporter permease [Salinisphaera aquimarina]|uniref:ABC transporter permease n=1 Tax=Salinisphaera aquimarina TaxID=2094031 RepID=A0ABV7ET96_9GAMM
MSAMLAIARHEMARLFVSPLAWTLLAVTQLLTGVLFAMSITNISLNPRSLGAYDGVSEMVGGGLLRFATVVLLLVVPLLTMRVFAEERKSGSLELLLAAPVSLSALVMGKFAGLMGYLTLMLVLIALMPLSLRLATPLDLGLLASGLIGLWLVMAAFTAIGVFVSSLTREPTLAAVATLGALLLLWLFYAVSTMDWQPVIFGETLPLAAAARALSLIGHHDALLRGVFSSADLLYFVIFTLCFLALTVVRLDMDRSA